ncbi:MAG: class I SAM-dependent methyltransferase [Cytophagaceae bacterium]|nr:class I SAM-dependent methyltransferase [Gemmatimonadaceae bacterium]
MDPRSDAKVLSSWHVNADAWTRAVRDRRIESRKLVTDAAIVEAVLALHPATMLDIGCGEGWLVRTLGPHGIRGTGLDAVPALIEQATRAGGGDFHVATYEAIADGAFTTTVDVVVANFSLIGDDAVSRMLRRVPTLLAAGGALVIQTLHPMVACGDHPYVDGWRDGSWAGFSDDFTDPAPWYFRTLASWIALLGDCGMPRVRIAEPLHPTTHKPASLILVAEAG